mgnify:CR=1 FL=1
MSLRSAVGQYLVAAMVFLALDLVWLSLVPQGLYEHFLGHLLADSPNAVAAAVFGSTSATATRAPSRAKASAMPWPIPRPAPVTSATLFFKRIRSSRCELKRFTACGG